MPPFSGASLWRVDMNWLDKLERRLGRLAIPNLMQYIAATMVVFLVFDTIQSGFSIAGFTALNPSLVLKGQVWRLVSFIFAPPTGVSLLAFVVIYFYYYMGKTLEYYWGTARFNLYYLFGIIGAIIAAFITGWGTNGYINLSLFLAYATLFPNQEVLLFFIIPIKVKYLAYLEAALFAYTILFSSWPLKAAAAASLLNYLIFFGPQMYTRVRNNMKYSDSRRKLRQQNGDSPWGR